MVIALAIYHINMKGGANIYFVISAVMICEIFAGYSAPVTSAKAYDFASGEINML
jgi:hypothetical protein